MLFVLVYFSYTVDISLGMCSCVAGGTGVICKHQIAVAEATMTALPQMFVTSMDNRKMLAEVALGEDKVPDDLFKDLVPSKSPSAESEVHVTEP